MADERMRRRLAAILAADAAGYSRLMAEDESSAVAAINAAREVFRGRVEANQGRVVDTAGDSVLAVFDLASAAAAAAIAIQDRLDPRLKFRIGLHLGEIVEKEDGTVYGEGVNIAARLQALVEPGGIALSDAVRGAVGRRVAAEFADRGTQLLKNIPEPVHWHCALPYQEPAPARALSPLERNAQDVASLPALAILPFTTTSEDKEQLYFCDGIRVDIQSALARIAGLVLIGIGTTNTYRGKSVPPAQAASELGVQYLLEGQVQRSGDRARVNVSLLEGKSGRVLWSGKYDRRFTDAFELQDEIVERVVTSIDVKLLSGEHARIWRKALRNPGARECFYLGMHEYMKGSRDANSIARAQFEVVTRLAPECSIGPTMVAFTHWWDAFRGWSTDPAGAIAQAAQWAERAMPMEDADGQAHTVMGHIHLYRREHDLALQRAREAVTLRPSCANANPHLANILYYCGQPAAAADRVRQAQRMAPVHPPWIRVVLAASLKEMQQWQAASGAAEDALRLKGDEIDARLVQVEICAATGKVAEAAQLAREILQLRPEFSVRSWLGTQPYRDAAVAERIATRLRDAGLPP